MRPLGCGAVGLMGAAMKDLRLFVGAVCAIALSGCITAEQQASVTESPKVITCRAGADCDAKWSKAGSWITEHSKYTVETNSDSLIQTSGPSTLDTDPSPRYKVAKVMKGPGEYAIEFAGDCDSIFECTPSLSTAQADFTQSVEAARPAPASPPASKKKKKDTYQTSSR
jgi:hypothetical protein